MHRRNFKNRVFILLTAVYLSLLLLISVVACFVSYHQRKQNLLDHLDSVYAQMAKEYSDTIDNFWQIYMPIVDNRSSVYSSLVNYFSSHPAEPLTFTERFELRDALQQVLLMDNRVQWVALYNPARQENYIAFNVSQFPVVYTAEAFPYADNVAASGDGMEIFPTKPVFNGNTTIATYALCGNTPSAMGEGKIIAGYSNSALEQIYQSAGLHFVSPVYLLTVYDPVAECDEVLYQSAPYPSDTRAFFVRSGTCGASDCVLSYCISRSDLFLYSHYYTPFIFLLVLAFSLLSVFIYSLVQRHITREVNIIRKGLSEIGQNHLSYRIPVNFKQYGFPEISQAINQMAFDLNENIERAYYYKLKQKESELAELQSKFNPHFLYNSLEMLRSRCCQNGDFETAGLITDLSGIFRGFIGAKTFIPVPEELSFTRRYLSLFGARYQDQVQIEYNIDNECMKYGIVRNVFQPLIENYFVHGFESSSGESNFIRLSGRAFDDASLLFIVEDNGTGMTEDDLEMLNGTLNEPVHLSSESYGLKNLQQRLKLFYGAEYGMTIMHNSPKGLHIEIRVRKLTCEEYEAAKA